MAILDTARQQKGGWGVINSHQSTCEAQTIFQFKCFFFSFCLHLSLSHSLSLTYTHTLSHFLSFVITLALFLSHTVSHCFSLTLYLTHSHFLSHTLALLSFFLTLPYTLTLSVSSYSLILTLSISHSTTKHHIFNKKHTLLFLCYRHNLSQSFFNRSLAQKVKQNYNGQMCDKLE